MPRVKSTSRVSRRQSSPGFDYHSSSDDSLRSHTNATRRPAAIHPSYDDSLAHLEHQLQILSILGSETKKRIHIHKRNRDTPSHPVVLTPSRDPSHGSTANDSSRSRSSSPALPTSSLDTEPLLLAAFEDLSLDDAVTRAGALERYSNASISPPSPSSPFYPQLGIPQTSSPFVQIEDDQWAEDLSPWRLAPVVYVEESLETRFGSLSLVTDIAP